MARFVENGGGNDSDNDIEEVGEEASLLSSPSISKPDLQDSPAQPKSISHRTQCTWPWKYVVILCMALAIVSDIGEDLFAVPKVRLYESVVCTQYYSQNDPSFLGPGGSVPEKFCKIDQVQDEVAFVQGWQLFFDSVPAILLPIPYGYIADKFGRKWILCLALTGYTLSWAFTLFLVGVIHAPLRLVWLSSLFFLIGGGPTTETTLITTVVADVVPPELRTIVFFYRFCTDLVADFVTPPATAILMDRNLWYPLLAAVAFNGFSVLMALFLPETLPIAISEQVARISSSSSIISSTSDADDQPAQRRDRLTWIRETGYSFSFVTKNAAVAILIPTFLISKVGRQSGNILFQYVSKKYDWSLSQAGLLLSLRAAVNIFLFAVILPVVTNYALARASAASRDLWIGKASIILMIVGSFMLFSSPSAAFMIMGLIVYTFGTGFPPIMRSLVTFLVESHHTSNTSDIARLYAIISAMEGIGSLVAGPGMAWAFRLGMSLGPAWLGLPFAFAAILFTLVSIIVFTIRI